MEPTKEVLFFTREHCPNCKAMYPIWNEITEGVTKYDYSIIDCDKTLDAAKYFGVQTLPTFILTQEGKELSRMSGFVKKDALLAWLS